MATRRQHQIADAVKREVSELIQQHIRDPRLGFVTVTSVEISPDLRHARIFASVLGTTEEMKSSFEVLKHASGFLRHELGTRLQLRYTPDLEFREDIGVAHSDRINRLLHQIEDEKKQ